MLSYRHSYHAGNHADVLKHTVLSLCLNHLKEKSKPFIYLDTHAGAGRYLLQSKEAEKTQEHLTGIDRIWHATDTPELLSSYLGILRRYNDKQLKYYLGSPLFAKNLLRSDDRLLLTELHSIDFRLLRHEFLKDKRAAVLREDGYHQLKSKLPPREKRGMVLIDPSYELKSDYQTVVEAVAAGYKRFKTGIYTLWYPVVSRSQTQRMINNLISTGIKRVLQIELAIRPDNMQRGMTASGMIIVNPPWQLKTQMESLLPWLHMTLVPGNTGNYCVKQLISE